MVPTGVTRLVLWCGVYLKIFLNCALVSGTTVVFPGTRGSLGFCQNGVATSGANCHFANFEECISCNVGYRLSDSKVFSKCVIY